MSIIYCDEHGLNWDSDWRSYCPICENELIYEDTLPANITDAEYDAWYAESQVIDGVRMGPKLVRHY